MRQAALRRAHYWRNVLKARRAHLAKMIHHQKRAAAADRRASAAAAKAWRHRQATAKKLGFSKVEFAASMRRFRASKAAAIRANRKVHAHVRAGMKAGHM
jgi:hypothetical protein